MTKRQFRTRDFAIVFRYLAGEPIKLIAWHFSMEPSNVTRIARYYGCPYRNQQTSPVRRPLSKARIERLELTAHG